MKFIAIFTAQVLVRCIEVATATFLGIGFVFVVVVHHSVATLTLCGVVHGRSAAARVRSKDPVTQFSVAAYLARLVRVVGCFTAAGVVPTVDHFVAATLGVVTVGFLDNLRLAARVVTVVVHLSSTAG